MTRMLTEIPDAGVSRALAAAYHRGAQAAAAGVGVYALAALVADARGAVHAELPTLAAVALLGAALAILLREPGGGWVNRRMGRACGHAAAATPILVALVHWEGQWRHRAASLPGMWALCFLLLGASLLGKPRLPRLGVGADIFVGFVGYLVVLTHLFGVPTAVRNAPTLSTATGLPLLILAGAWLAAFPRRRPVSFFVESGSAALILHRVLPITFVFPALFVGLASLRQHGQTWAQLGVWLLVLAVIGFGAALFALIANALDRMDAVRETAEQELRAAALRYRRLFDENPQPMWLLEVESLRFIGVNTAACSLYEYSPEEFGRLTVREIRREGDLAGLRNQIIGSENHGIRLRRHYTRSGRPLDMEIQVHRTNWQGREVWVCYGNDVTARLRTLEQLRSSEAQVRVLLESTTEGIYAVDMQGKFVWSNPAAARLLGFASAGDLLGRPVHALIHHSYADGRAMALEDCPLWAAVRRGSPFADEMTLWRSDGSSFPADFRSSPLMQDGELRGAVVTFADVTDRKRLNLQFQQAQKMEAVGRLAAGVAHDFNNLLTVINGYAEMLQRRPGAPEAPTRIGHILDASHRAASLTRQLLAFSRQQVLQPQALDLNQVLTEMDPLVRRLVGEDVQIQLALAPDLGTVHADPGQIGQVLMNLVANARDAMPEGGHLIIESANVELDARYAMTHPGTDPGEYVMLAVTDTGIGMDAATQAHIFEPFFTTKPKGSGTGLGLSMVFGVVKQSGGSMAVYSEPGRGTAFKIYLPRVPEHIRSTALPAVLPASPSGRERVLVLEDESSVRELVCEVLQDKGYVVRAFTNPQEALQREADVVEDLDLLISDVVMPGMDGRRLAEQLAQRHPGMRVLFISGYPERAASAHGNLVPGLPFIQKPFTPDALARKVREVLDGEAAAAGEARR